MTVFWKLLRAVVELTAAVTTLTGEVRLLREDLRPPDLRAVSFTAGPPEGE